MKCKNCDNEIVYIDVLEVYNPFCSDKCKKEYKDKMWKETEYHKPFIGAWRSGNYYIEYRLFRSRYSIYLSEFKGKGIWKELEMFETYSKEEADKIIENWKLKYCK